MSLQQALRQIPSVKRMEELQITLARESWSILWPHFDHPLTEKQREQVIASRNAYFYAQDELHRLLGKA